MDWLLTDNAANFTAFETDDEVLANLREYALANTLYWVSDPTSGHTIGLDTD